MSLWGLAAGLLVLGPGLGAPELPGLLERGGAEIGLKLTQESLFAPPATLPLPAADRVREVVLSPADPSPSLWRNLAVSFAPETRLWVLQGWPERPPAAGEAGFADWRDEVAARASQAETRAHDLAEESKTIPAADALLGAAEAARSGTLPGIASPDDLYRPNGGLNDRGLYLVAMTILAQLSGQSPEGIPPKLTRFWMSRDSVVTEPMAQALQRLAWQAVTESNAASKAKSDAAAPASPPPGLTATARPTDVEGLSIAESLGGVTARGIGFNLSGLADWSPQMPFLDVMKTARRWTGHLSGQWGGFEHKALEEGGWLDPDGWPKGLPPGVTGLTTLIFSGLPAEAEGIAGRYRLRHQGRAQVKLDGPVQIVAQRPGEIVFDYRPDPGNVMLTLSDIDTTNPIHAISVVREDRLAQFDAGAIFNPDWLTRLRGTEMLRFMDWMQTNDTEITAPEHLPRIGDYSYTRRGVPLSVMLRLAHELEADPWFTLPHRAQDATVRLMAETVHRDLAPGRKVYMEMSNEVWNLMFPQAQWAEAEGRARWGKEWAWVQYYGLRAAEMARIWAEVFADDPSRLVRVIGTQTGWLGLERDVLDAPLLQAEGGAPPYSAFDAVAVTGYVGGALSNEEKGPLLQSWLSQSQAAARAEAQALGLSGRAAEAHVERHRLDLAIKLALEEMRDGRHSGKPGDTLRNFLEIELPWHKAAAEERGLKLVMYEGGSHVVGHGPSQEVDEFTNLFVALNYTSEMGRLYRDLIDGWHSISDAPFAAFVDVGTPSKYGSWGALRHLGDDNPRWRALAKGTSE